MQKSISRVTHKLRREWTHQQNDAHIRQVAAQIVQHAPPAGPSPDGNPRPVIFFNASTRLSGLSLNAGFSLLTAWTLRLQGVPVVHFVCREGMGPCVLGTNRDNPAAPPP
ncbi:MAG: hypothetical protein PHQ40_15125, partial [Anaerolineaceae bacterium]|nr:hypothetical protein [Anaerolineaceae bacterium]